MFTETKVWSAKEVEQVWQKTVGSVSQGQDAAGAIISFSQYGNTHDELNHGWEIDHIKPRALGGSDDIGNLRALHWQNNRSKGDNYPEYTAVVSSENGRNVSKRVARIIK